MGIDYQPPPSDSTSTVGNSPYIHVEEVSPVLVTVHVEDGTGQKVLSGDYVMSDSLNGFIIPVLTIIERMIPIKRTRKLSHSDLDCFIS